jgi:hypothetical protein
LDAQLIISTMRDLDSCLPRMVNQLELDDKLESKDSLLDAFWQKQPSAKSLACLGVG